MLFLEEGGFCSYNFRMIGVMRYSQYIEDREMTHLKIC
jgi:hypothetical protein